MQYGSGSSYAPSIFQKEILTSKEETIQTAKAEIAKRLKSELSSISQGEKLQHQHRLKKAIEGLTAPPAPEQIELF